MGVFVYNTRTTRDRNDFQCRQQTHEIKNQPQTDRQTDTHTHILTIHARTPRPAYLPHTYVPHAHVPRMYENTTCQVLQTSCGDVYMICVVCTQLINRSDTCASSSYHGATTAAA